MKYNFEVRSIARQTQSIVEKHDSFVRGAQHLPLPWQPSADRAAPEPGAALSGILKVSELLGKGLGGQVVYQFRRPFRDEASQDDWIDISFNPARIDYRQLVDQTFLDYAAAFDAYYADIADDEFIYMDFDRVRELGIDKRQSLYRLSPVSYLRRDFCQQALGMSPARIVERLQGKIEVARETLDGVFLVLTSGILPADEMDTICWRAKNWLSGE
jgi:hypothetical protein